MIMVRIAQHLEYTQKLAAFCQRYDSLCDTNMSVSASVLVIDLAFVEARKNIYRRNYVYSV